MSNVVLDTPTDSGPAPAPKPLSGRGALILAIVAVIAAAVVVARLLFGSLQPHLYSGTVLQGLTPAAPMDGLVLRNGSPVDLTAHEGKVVLVYFGYTNCPDVCPVTLQTAARAKQLLDPSRQDLVELILVTVDPARDTPESAETFVDRFDPDFMGATGPADAVATTASLYGIFHLADHGDHDHTDDPAASGEPAPTNAEPSAENDDYLVEHTTSLLAIGPDGSLRVVWPPGVEADLLAADLEALLS